jgi:regulator of sigma E protease
MVTILSFLIVLTVLVMAHELGHLIAAKRLGIRVETFSIGFGPKIARIRRNGTDYVIGLIPLGGYVQLGDATPTAGFRADSPHYFERPPFHKIIVALAGPAANFLLTVLVLSVIAFVGVDSAVFMDSPAGVGWVSPGSPAAKAGLRPGDRVVEIDGKPVNTWRDLVTSLPVYEKSQIAIKAVRHDRISSFILSGCSRLNAGLAPAEMIVVGAVAPGSPAAEAGIRIGDVIRATGNQPVTTWAQFQETASRAHGSLAIGIDREGRAKTVEVVPDVDLKTGKGLVGIYYRPEIARRTLGFPGALKNGIDRTGEIVADSLGTFRALLTGSISLKALGGPVAIAQASGATAKAGLLPLLTFLAFLSVQLGVFNLLPFIPIVDGGQVTLFLIETCRRRPLGLVALERVAKAGWAAMGVLILFVTYNDVLKLF